MSLLKTILAGEIDILRKEVHNLAEAEISLLERVVGEIREHRRFKPIRCEFGPFTFQNDDGENVIMSAQQLRVGVAYTAALVFTDANGATGVGPVGVVSASDPSVSVGLSADGQSINLILPQALTGLETIRWHDPSDVIPDATVEVINADADAPPAEEPPPAEFVATGVAIGAFVEAPAA